LWWIAELYVALQWIITTDREIIFSIKKENKFATNEFNYRNAFCAFSSHLEQGFDFTNTFTLSGTPVPILMCIFNHLLTKFWLEIYSSKSTNGFRQISISSTCLQAAFTPADPKKQKKTVKSSVSFCTFGICTRRNCL